MHRSLNYEYDYAGQTKNLYERFEFGSRVNY